MKEQIVSIDLHYARLLKEPAFLMGEETKMVNHRCISWHDMSVEQKTTVIKLIDRIEGQETGNPTCDDCDLNPPLCDSCIGG